MVKDPYIVFGAPTVGEGEKRAVLETLDSGWLGTGPRVRRFEQAFQDYTGARHAVALNSCTAALHLSMVVSGIGPGDEVITCPMTFAATANAILHCGARPVFVDCRRDTMNIDPDAVEAAITPRTRAIVPIHFAGRPADLWRLRRIARAKGLLLVEDAAHALEAVDRGLKVGTVGDFTCFSFYVTKNITTAEGGMVTTNDGQLAERIKTYSLHGLSTDAWGRFSDRGYRHYQVVSPGFKYNLTDLAASIGLVQLGKVDAWHAMRVKLWRAYDSALAGLPLFTPALPEPGTVHARHLYTILIDTDRSPRTRDEFMVAMHRRGVGTGVHYRGLHLHPYYRDRFGLRPEDYPNATWISERTVSLPLSPSVTPAQRDRIVRTIRELLVPAPARGSAPATI